MRLLLLAAVFLRLAAPAGGTHCGPDAPHAAAPMEHAHHGEPAACDHCPPTACATQPACATLLLVMLAKASLIGPALHPAAPTLATDDATWTSRDHRPPVPPPQPELA